ncbi:hypothetical protein AMAG_00170 [Allomyces macrogynus ATCC 38327]|uniref:Uncharacterized protein n=1 Tax=Allomyces macrogynus (strain ATCC 38327) TaxID=578462 RepID=A0A0L0RVL0_ALLM3|nr:hypothetical protein AMAG_00170 [Allomyces macrogynus ATCC 38327]|eukprot:KNE54174.1 hypothetical protein AMAG_00170 [Allomyces macrogynus ATCC 38327]
MPDHLWDRTASAFANVFDALLGRDAQIALVQLRTLQAGRTHRVLSDDEVQAANERVQGAAVLRKRDDGETTALDKEQRNTLPSVLSTDAGRFKPLRRGRCSGVGIYKSYIGPLYNCAGSYESAASMRDMTLKRVATIPCDACAVGDVACQSTCCPKAVDSATYRCICPMTRICLDCEQLRPVSCTVTSDPTASLDLACAANPAPLPPSASALPPCPCVASTARAAPLAFRTRCAFIARPNVNLATDSAQFSYVYRNNETWVVRDRANMTLRVAAVSPRMVGSARHCGRAVVVPVSYDQAAGMDGTVLLTVPFEVADVTRPRMKAWVNVIVTTRPVFWVGGRIIVEAELIGVPGVSTQWVGRPVLTAFLGTTDAPQDVLDTVRASKILAVGASTGYSMGIMLVICMGVLLGLGIL